MDPVPHRARRLDQKRCYNDSSFLHQPRSEHRPRTRTALKAGLCVGTVVKQLRELRIDKYSPVVRQDVHHSAELRARTGNGRKARGLSFQTTRDRQRQ